MNEPLADLFRYNRWAMLMLLDACRDLPDSQLDVQLPGFSGSARETLLHVVGGQQTFVLRTRGRQHEGELNRSSGWPGFEALRAVAVQSSDELIAIAAELEAEREIDLAYLGKRYRYPVAFFLTHALAHGVEHRTEITRLLAQQGVPTPDLDAWEYAAAQGYGREI